MFVQVNEEPLCNTKSTLLNSYGKRALSRAPVKIDLKGPVQ